MAEENIKSSSLEPKAIAAETAEREELKPKGICCPEGVWVCEGWYSLGETIDIQSSGQNKAIDLA